MVVCSQWYHVFCISLSLRNRIKMVICHLYYNHSMSCLAYIHLQSIWIFREIFLGVILFISIIIIFHRKCLVLPIIIFSQFVFSRKSISLSFDSSSISACLLYFQDSVFSCLQSSSVNMDFVWNLSYCNLNHKSSQYVPFFLWVVYVGRRCLLHEVFLKMRVCRLENLFAVMYHRRWIKY